jgi:hypothetical protein
VINRLRWHLHELDPGWEPGPRSLDRPSAFDKVERRIAGADLTWLTIGSSRRVHHADLGVRGVWRLNLCTHPGLWAGLVLSMGG